MAIMLKAVGILMLISFITGAVVSNYAISKAKEFIGGTSNSKISDKQIRVSTPIEELPKDLTLPEFDIGNAEKITIVFPSLKYGEITVNVPIINNRKC